jgi:peptidoglycan/xylan/chitin deacetylase (PgdA/CDA1 family)
MNTKKAYLTIDDAPSNDFRNKVDFLAERGIPALFFCNGGQIPQHENDVIYAIRKGYIIGNHSWSHPYFSDLSLEDCLSEIRRTDEIIEQVYQKSGVDQPGKFFRFPYFDPGGDENAVKFNQEAQEPPNVRMTFPRDDKRKAIQSFLKDLGYRQPSFQGITLQWFHQAGLLNRFDVFSTFTQKEYWLNKENAPEGLNRAEAILAKIDEDNPEKGLALNDPSTSDIILIHDHDYSQDIMELFYRIISRYIEKGICFLRVD